MGLSGCLTYRRNAIRQAPGSPIDQLSAPPAFIDVVNGGEYRDGWDKKLEQAGDDVGVKAVAVDEIRLEVAKKSAGLSNASEEADGILAHIEMDDLVRRGPLLFETRTQDHD